MVEYWPLDEQGGRNDHNHWVKINGQPCQFFLFLGGNDLGIAMYSPGPASASRLFVTVIYDQFPSCPWRLIGTRQYTVCMEAKGESIDSFDERNPTIFQVGKRESDR